MRSGVSSGLTTAAGAAAVLIGLAVIDDGVQGRLATLFAGRSPTGELLSVGARLQELGSVIFQAVRDQSIEHAPLTIFVLAAAVLVLFMLRT